MAALQKSGEENWKKKVPKVNAENPVLDILNSNIMSNKNANNLNQNNNLNKKDPSDLIGNSGSREDDDNNVLLCAPSARRVKKLSAPASSTAASPAKDDYVSASAGLHEDEDEQQVFFSDRRGSSLRPVSIHERVNKLQIAQQSWQAKVKKLCPLEYCM